MPKNPFMRNAAACAATAFSLLELILALGITAFCLMALLGLFCTGLNTSQASAEELQAAHLAQSIISSRRASPAADLGADFPVSVITPGSSVPLTLIRLDADGQIVSSGSKARYGMEYRVDAPSISERKPATLYLCLFWPADASPDQATGRYELTTMLAAPR